MPSLRSSVFAALAAHTVLLALGPGCSSAPLEPDVGPVEDSVAARTGHRVHWDQGRPEDEQARRAVAAWLSEPLTPESAVQVALFRNARLQGAFEELSVAQADLVQAGALSNPMLGIELRGPGQPAWPLEVHLLDDFMQIVTRALREHVAQAQIEAARARVGQAALDLIHDVQQAFVAVQAGQQSLALQSTLVEASAASAEAAELLLAAGNVLPLEVDHERALDVQARLSLSRARLELLERRERLTTLLGLWGEDTSWTIAEPLPEAPAAEPPTDDLEQRALAQRLDLAAARQAIEVVARELGVTDATAMVPHFTAGLHFESEPDHTKTTGPSVDFPIPIFDSGKARVARDEARLRQAQQEYVALGVEIRSEVRAASARTAAARERALVLRDELLPLHARRVEESQRLYNGMQLGVFDLLRARQEQVEASREELEARADYWVSRTALERAVGGRIDAQDITAGAQP